MPRWMEHAFSSLYQMSALSTSVPSMSNSAHASREARIALGMADEGLVGWCVNDGGKSFMSHPYRPKFSEFARVQLSTCSSSTPTQASQQESQSNARHAASRLSPRISMQGDTRRTQADRTTTGLRQRVQRATRLVAATLAALRTGAVTAVTLTFAGVKWVTGDRNAPLPAAAHMLPLLLQLARESQTEAAVKQATLVLAAALRLMQSDEMRQVASAVSRDTE